MLFQFLKVAAFALLQIPFAHTQENVVVGKNVLSEVAVDTAYVTVHAEDIYQCFQDCNYRFSSGTLEWTTCWRHCEDDNRRPNIQPKRRPNRQPNKRPNRQPNKRPNRQPKKRPNRQPNKRPNRQPNKRPNRQPNKRPNRHPSVPNRVPDRCPGCRPTRRPTGRRPTPRPIHKFDRTRDGDPTRSFDNPTNGRPSSSLSSWDDEGDVFDKSDPVMKRESSSAEADEMSMSSVASEDESSRDDVMAQE